ncbi:PAS domain S-box protein [Pseudoduganella sp. GCM10020061]|uniref:hybrid sensor histidine kinase/response regulator n=1 Tax=Pseudoduganella sp. GCM10020061 TaxID=3317345 RepID=UPI0036286848
MDRNTEWEQPPVGDPLSILESITDAFFLLDREWRFTYLNRHAEIALDRHPGELIGKNLWTEFPDANDSIFESMYRRAVADQRPVTFNALYPGLARWYEVHAYPAPAGLAVYFRDSTEQVKSEQRLRESEVRFRLMADSIPQIVWITDSEGRHEFFNAQWHRYTGASPNQENAAEIAAQFVHPDDRASTMQAWQDAAREGRTFITEHRIRSAAGDYRWFLVRAEPHRDPASGAIVRWFGTSTDVHESKRLEASLRQREERYRKLFNSIDEGFCTIEMIFDEAGRAVDYRYCEVNAMFVEQTGLHNVEGKRVRELLPEHESRWFEIYGSVARTGEPVRFENEARDLKRWYDLYAFRPDESDTRLVAVLFKDITERKRLEQDMQRSARRKDEFLAMLAHELRNPLAPIGAAADLLRLGRIDEAHVRQTSDVIARQVRHMSSLVDDLLDVSRVTTGRIVLETAALDAKKIVADAVEQARPLIEARRHHIGLHMPPQPAWIEGDANRLVQVVANLLNNAAKYTPEGGNIGLRIEVQGGQVLIAVKDNGIGLAPDFLEGVFDMFSQAQRTADRSQGGLGIGLALVRSLVELHRGSVTAHSAGLGQGSEFIVRLPRVAAPAPQERAPERPLASVHGGGLRLMVVDDNVDAAAMLAMFLESTGHSVAVEYDSRRALERAREERPDVMLLDIGLPGMDGNELARRLRAQPETAGATLIAVTGYGQEQDRRATAEVGFDHHFVKPVDIPQLSALLAELATASAARS